MTIGRGVEPGSKGRTWQQWAWWEQVLKDYLARALGLLFASTQNQRMVETGIAAIALLMIFHSVGTFVTSLQAGTLLISLPMFLMFIAGLYGVRLVLSQEGER